MMAAEENWQTKLLTIVEKTAFIFNNELLSDVKFVVSLPNGGGESKKAIPAHKFVLAINSPVFFAMFYGRMAGTKDSIELPDCEYESLLELFRFLYSDKVNLSGNNVMQVLYLANKYIVPSLAKKCTEYLRDNLKASNVFLILPHAQIFEDKDLKDRCWKVIEEQTEEAVTSDEFVAVERSVVESVVKREVLNVREVELFKAVDRWAIKECERQRMTSDGRTKTKKDFASVVFDSHLLNHEEFCNLIKQYNNFLNNPLPFVQACRGIFSKQRCQRFKTFLSGWSYNCNGPDCILLTVNKPITLHGVQHFGSEREEYTVKTDIIDPLDNNLLVSRGGNYASKRSEISAYYGFDVLFDRPIILKANKEYKIKSIIKGPTSWYGKDGQTSVKCQGVRFTFRCSAENSNGTDIERGQFPEILFSVPR